MLLSSNSFIATTGAELARATRGPKGGWSVEFLLPSQKVCCLAANPVNPNIIYAGTEGQGIWHSDDWG